MIIPTMRLLLGSAGAAFSPLDVANGVAWLDASTGLTVTGSGASAWVDQFGNGNDLAQSTDAARMALVSGWRNGKAALQGATGDYIDRATYTGGALSVFWRISPQCARAGKG